MDFRHHDMNTFKSLQGIFCVSLWLHPPPPSPSCNDDGTNFVAGKDIRFWHHLIFRENDIYSPHLASSVKVKVCGNLWQSVAVVIFRENDIYSPQPALEHTLPQVKVWKYVAVCGSLWESVGVVIIRENDIYFPQPALEHTLPQVKVWKYVAFCGSLWQSVGLCGNLWQW